MSTGIHVEECGRGKPIVLLHGSGAGAEALRPLGEALARDYRVLIPSLPGYPPSPPLGRAWVERDVLRSLVDALVERGVHEAPFVGWSMGAYRSLVLALDGLFDVTGLILLGGFATLDEEERASRRTFATLARTRSMPPGIATQLLFSPAFASSHPELCARSEAFLASIDPETFSGDLAAVAQVEDLRPRLGAIAVPVVARVGALDIACPPAKSEDIVRGVQRGELQVVEGVGHSLVAEDLPGTLAATRAALSS